MLRRALSRSAPMAPLSTRGAAGGSFVAAVGSSLALHPAPHSPRGAFASPSRTLLAPMKYSVDDDSRQHFSLQHLTNEKPQVSDQKIHQIRNIAVAAHIDAGKTTTTERMLFYAGVTKKVGDVDKGNTQTDYMSQEMERGITIQSAAVSLYWKEHAINLIDTPGHVDFGIEVERSLRVVDGVIALFDAAVGVQAQSFTVLKQAENFDIPTIAFMNKMDKTNANFFRSVETIKTKLGKEPLLLEIPLFGDNGEFEGTIDVVRSVALRFSGKHGEVVTETGIGEENAYIQEICAKYRKALFEQLTARDDQLAEQVIEALEATDGDETAAENSIPISDIKASIRRQTLLQPLVHRALKNQETAECGAVLPPLIPTLCGASRRDVGVQPLLNAVNDYLPAPTDRQKTLRGFSRNGTKVHLPVPSNMPSVPVIALAFKVTHANIGTGVLGEGGSDPLVFFRVYSGRVLKGMQLLNRNRKDKAEKVEKMFVLHGGFHSEVPYLSTGMIGAAFLRNTTTGDTLSTPSYCPAGISTTPLGNSTPSAKVDDENAPVCTLAGIDSPPPVLSYSVEAATRNQSTELEKALAMLEKEDPSLRVSRNQQAQLVLGGMGELHLEIAMSRLDREYGLQCKLLRAVVEYKETLTRVREFKNVQLLNNGLPLFNMSFKVVPSVTAELEERDKNASVSFFCPEQTTMQILAQVAQRQHAQFRETEAPLDVLGMVFTKQEVRELFGRPETFRQSHSMLSECINAISTGLKDAAHMGPLAGLPMHGFAVELTALDSKGGDMADVVAITNASRGYFQQMLRTEYACDAATGAKGKYSADVGLLEPIMHVEVQLTESDYVSDVMSLFAQKNAVSCELTEDQKGVQAIVALRNATKIGPEMRKATKGNGYFWATLHHYRMQTQPDVLNRILANLGVHR